MNPFEVQLSTTEMLQTGIALVIVVACLAAVLFSLWGGFLLITSGGNEEKVKPAVNHIRHSLLGLIILLIIIFVIPKVLGFVGVPFANDLTPNKIFARMKEISSNITGASVNTEDSLSPSSIDSNGLPSDFSDL